MHAGDKPAQESEWRPPKKFANYIMDKEVDTGGMGIIYRAYKMPEKHAVAMKFMIEQSQYRRFQRESATGRLLHHRNFVRFHDDGQVEGHFYIVMDYIDGKPLKRYLEGATLTSDQRLALFHKIVSAIAYAHDQGIIHRDIKPGNILVDTEDEPVILDFGLVKNLSIPSEEKTALTISGQILGTPGYMSPEQARGEIENQDERSDIFCLGIILYEMLTARNPFPGDNFLEICYNIAHKSAYPIERVLSGIPPQLAKICNKALARKKSDRYQSAEEFAGAIENYQAQRKKSVDVPTINYESAPYPVLVEDEDEPAPATFTEPATEPRPGPQKGQLSTVLCSSCGALNSSNNVQCNRCGNPIRKTSIPKLKGIPTPKQPLQIVMQTPPSKTPQPSKKPVIQPAIKMPPPHQPTPAPAVTPSPALKLSDKKPILLTPDKETREQETARIAKKQKIGFFVGSVAMPFSMIPVVVNFCLPWYSYLPDIFFGAGAEILTRRFNGKGSVGGVMFAGTGLLSLVGKMAMAGIALSSPRFLLYGVVETVMLLFLGYSIGTIFYKTRKKRQ